MHQLSVRLLLPRLKGMAQKKQRTFEIALSGISAALALLCLVLYYYVPVGQLSFLALSSLALTLPLMAKSVRGSALAYLAAGGLAVAATGPLAVVPFAFLFGWQPVVMGWCQRYLPRKPYITLPIKAALFNAGLYGVYALYGLGDTINRVLARLAWRPAYWAIALIGTAIWIGYDYLIAYLQRWIQRRAAKVIAKYLPPDPKGDVAIESDPFDPTTPNNGQNEGDVPHKNDADDRQ